MSGVILCSLQAKVPYYIHDLDINVYSIEEIAYYLYHHTALVDEDFFSEDLIDYLENVLGQKLIANGLKQANYHHSSLVEKIGFVVKSASYYDREDLAKFQKKLEAMSRMNYLERLKAKGDVLLASKKFNNAYSCYKFVLSKANASGLSHEFYGKILNNMGVICVNMFRYENAADFFRQSYEMNHDLFVMKQLIMADILSQDQELLQEDIDRYRVSERMYLECEDRLKKTHAEAIKLPEPEEIDALIHDYKVDS